MMRSGLHFQHYVVLSVLLIAAVPLRNNMWVLAERECTCAPSIVSSFDEARHYCCGVGGHSGQYFCHDPDGCNGTIDYQLESPPCSRNITSCSRLEFASVCSKVPDDPDELIEQPGEARNCDPPEYGRPGKFSCWDKVDDHWCKGVVTTPYGTEDDPVCPTQPVASCSHLRAYGWDSTFYCDCTVDFGYGSFACRNAREWPDTNYEENNPICFGTISFDVLTNAEKSSVPAGLLLSEQDRDPLCPPKALLNCQFNFFSRMGIVWYASYNSGFYEVRMNETTHGGVTCFGFVDPAKSLPSCTVSEIPSCQKEFFYQACAQVNADFDYYTNDKQLSLQCNNRHYGSGGKFRCIDKQILDSNGIDVWCEGSIVSPVLPQTTYDVICPEAVQDIQALSAYGLQDCGGDISTFHCDCYREGMECLPKAHCTWSSRYTNGCGSRVDPNEYTWCRGTIDPTIPFPWDAVDPTVAPTSEASSTGTMIPPSPSPDSKVPTVEPTNKASSTASIPPPSVSPDSKVLTVAPTTKASNFGTIPPSSPSLDSEAPTESDLSSSPTTTTDSNSPTTTVLFLNLFVMILSIGLLYAV